MFVQVADRSFIIPKGGFLLESPLKLFLNSPA